MSEFVSVIYWPGVASYWAFPLPWAPTQENSIFIEQETCRFMVLGAGKGSNYYQVVGLKPGSMCSTVEV